MDHATDLDVDTVISQHLREIVDLISDPIPKGVGLSRRYVLCF